MKIQQLINLAKNYSDLNLDLDLDSSVFFSYDNLQKFSDSLIAPLLSLLETSKEALEDGRLSDLTILQEKTIFNIDQTLNYFRDSNEH